MKALPGFTGLDTLASMRKEVTNMIKTGLGMLFFYVIILFAFTD
jgi:hypothetical protein